MGDPRYTVAISNYNMARTLRASLTSVLEQLDDRFEVIVIDDGSDDGSAEILRELEADYELLRVVYDAGNDNLGEARNHSFRVAEGEYVLSAVDTDDQFTRVIPEFVTLYEEIEADLDREFLLLAGGLYMAPRSLVRDVPYRSLGYGEDRDFYRRLLARDALVSISHLPFRHSIGYDRPIPEKFRVGVETIVVQFRSGLAFRPYVEWAFAELRSENGQLERHRALAHLVIAPFAYLLSFLGPRYEAPTEYRDIGRYKRALRDVHRTLTGLETRFDVSVDRAKLGHRGRALFDIDERDEILD
ncbi:MAG: glycosyltransferase family 2 protein [Halobaculum sp.]